MQKNPDGSFSAPEACSLACLAMTQLQELRKELIDVKKQVEEIVRGISCTDSYSEVKQDQTTVIKSQKIFVPVKAISMPNLNSIDDKENAKPDAFTETSTVVNNTALKDVSNLNNTVHEIQNVIDVAGEKHEKNIDAKEELNQPDLKTII